MASHTLRHGDQVVGEIASMDDVRRLREELRGREWKFGIVGNTLDFVLSGNESHLAYLSPRDRRLAEAEAKAISDALAANQG